MHALQTIRVNEKMCDSIDSTILDTCSIFDYSAFLFQESFETNAISF
jgi:hypothetical protein